VLDDGGGAGGLADTFETPSALWAPVLDWLIVLRLIGVVSTARAAPEMPVSPRKVTWNSSAATRFS
jgi:hypothetical protein